jgi:hypothetical protein
MTPCATAHGVFETIWIASARSAASITAKLATGKGDDMKAEFSVVTPAASGLRTYTGAPAAPINAPRSLISASWA